MCEKTYGNGWSGNVSLDLDVILAELRPDDWLASAVSLDRIDDAKTSVATGIELGYAMEDVWDRPRLTSAHRESTDLGITFVPPESDALDAAETPRDRYDRLNVFDGVHLGTARVLGESIISTDSLFGDISEVSTVDPRTIE